MRVPVVRSGTEVERLLAAMSRPNHRVAVMLAYGAGLRVGEICRLRVDDIDAKRMVLRNRSATCGRERHVMLSARLLRELRAYRKAARLVDFTPPATPRPDSRSRARGSRLPRRPPNASRTASW